MEMKEAIRAIGANLRTQDNRITENPIFMVERKVTDTGYDPIYCDDDVLFWHCDGFAVRRGDEEFDGLMEREDNGDLPEEYSYSGFKERWEPVQPFFTEEAANRYVKSNKHNLGECRVFVHGGYRNDEWAVIRKLLLTITEAPND